MKSMKSLLLGSAAGLATVASAQAADLPVKAKPVEYVKVCSQYGAGFFYVPGTDTCLKFGMYLRADHMFGMGSQGNYYLGGAPGRETRSDTNQWYNYRARINLTTDWRTQTDYGVLRAYAAIVGQQNQGDGAGNVSPSLGGAGILRAYIQFAGFTVGHAVSYFDFFNGADYGYLPSVWGPGTGVNGTDIVAYTFQLGNGWSASIDVEDGGGAGTAAGNGRGKYILNASRTAALTPGASTWDNGGAMPDIAGNIRVDQAWGSAQIMGGLHDNNAGYYNSLSPFANSSTGISTVFGHPADKWGWAVGGAFKLLNFLQPKDVLEFQAQYSVGAAGFGGTTGLYGNMGAYGSGNTLALGWGTDSVYSNQTGLALTEVWGWNAAYQHWWNSQWRTAVVGGGTWYNYNSTATASLCAGATGTSSGGALSAFTFQNCSPNFSQWAVSTRTAWNPHPTMEIGLDLMYTKLQTGFAGLATLPVAGARPAGTYLVEDQNVWITALRFQKTVLP